MSALGSGLTLIAAPLYVAAHTRSPLIVSATTGVAWLPWLLFALPGGVLVDRVDRRRPGHARRRTAGRGGSGPSWPKGSAGSPASGCCARWRS